MTALSPQLVEAFARAALAEDVGRGDLTTGATVDPATPGTASLVFRVPGVVCGLPVAAAVFRALDAPIRFTVLRPDGSHLAAAEPVARIEGSATAILTGERVALNFVARLSATATLTRRYVDAVRGTRAQILDTRKTTPGLRQLEKYAVRTGGGRNHRLGLDDGVLIKDNHIAFAGGLAEAIRRARLAVPPGMRIEVEVDTLDQLREALGAGADMILLDNMPVSRLREAVPIAAGRVPLEASGGIDLGNVRAAAEAGVDFISVGALTHSAGSLDVSLEVP
ncbi:MAG: carboxylating nicotinate-nucleotide diphosphorylase [Chloroflexi bacterium]|nr:carboxylating nicotinate-nucleotide diphosphorylase [Chloroflexota bacterium]